jgi:hypothetical protein
VAQRGHGGLEPAVHENEPQCGYFVRKYKQADGSYLPYPATIYLVAVTDGEGNLSEPEVLACDIGGEKRDPKSEWTWLAKHPISRAQYMEWIATAAFGESPVEAPSATSPEAKKEEPRPLFDHNRPPY